MHFRRDDDESLNVSLSKRWAAGYPSAPGWRAGEPSLQDHGRPAYVSGGGTCPRSEGNKREPTLILATVPPTLGHN